MTKRRSFGSTRHGESDARGPGSQGLRIKIMEPAQDLSTPKALFLHSLGLADGTEAYPRWPGENLGTAWRFRPPEVGCPIHPDWRELAADARFRGAEPPCGSRIWCPFPGVAFVVSGNPRLEDGTALRFVGRGARGFLNRRGRRERRRGRMEGRWVMDAVGGCVAGGCLALSGLRILVSAFGFVPLRFLCAIGSSAAPGSARPACSPGSAPARASAERPPPC